MQGSEQAALGLKQCRGEPEGTCDNPVPSEWTFCLSCKARRARPMTRASIIMQDAVDEIRKACLCGGDNTAPKHGESLLHRRWLWGLEHGRR